MQSAVNTEHVCVIKQKSVCDINDIKENEAFSGFSASVERVLRTWQLREQGAYNDELNKRQKIERHSRKKAVDYNVLKKLS